jgi:hypothetical protein
MDNYGTMKVFMLYVDSHGQTKCKTLETRHFITLEEAREYARKVRVHNDPEKIDAVWEPERVSL